MAGEAAPFFEAPLPSLVSARPPACAHARPPRTLQIPTPEHALSKTLTTKPSSQKTTKKPGDKQGSLASKADLDRAQLAAADAVFLLCNQMAGDAEAEDADIVVGVLAIADYLHAQQQRGAAGRGRRGPAGPLHRAWEFYQQVSRLAAGGPPRIFAQVLRPETERNLHQTLVSIRGAGGTPEAAFMDARHARHASFTAFGGGGGVFGSAASATAGASGRTLERRRSIALAAVATRAAAADDAFWSEFCDRLIVQSALSLKHSLLSQAACACRGLVPLLSNMCTTVRPEEVPRLAQARCRARRCRRPATAAE